MGKNVCDLMLEEWNRKYSPKIRLDERETRTVTSLDGKHRFDFVYSRQLGKWYRQNIGKEWDDSDACYFCSIEEQDLLVKVRNLWVIQQYKNVERGHFLLVGEEHREFPNWSDLSTLLEISSQGGFSLFGNFRDSGASYPIHAHYQCIFVRLPIVDTEAEEIFEDSNLTFGRLDYFVPAWVYVPKNDIGQEKICRAVAQIDKPYNPLAYGRKLYIFLRTQSVPPSLKFKFGGAEIAGRIYFREKSLFDKLDFDTTAQAIREVCCGESETKTFERVMLDKLLRE